MLQTKIISLLCPKIKKVKNYKDFTNFAVFSKSFPTWVSFIFKPQGVSVSKWFLVQIISLIALSQAAVETMKQWKLSLLNAGGNNFQNLLRWWGCNFIWLSQGLDQCIELLNTTQQQPWYIRFYTFRDKVQGWHFC